MEKTIGLNDFAVSWDTGKEAVLIAENISQEEAFELLAKSENYFLEIWSDGHWNMLV